MLDVKLKFQPGHADGKDWMSGGPVKVLFWNVTRSCNFNCQICFSNSGAPDPDELTLPEAKTLIRRAHELGVVDVIITGGEPFMRPDLLEILSCMAELGITARIATNGSLLTEKLVERIRRETRTTSFLISLDSLDPCIYSEIHRVPPIQLEKALEALRFVRAHDFHTTVSIRLTPRTLPGIIDIVDRAADEGWATISLQRPVFSGRVEGAWPPMFDILPALEPVFEHFLSMPSRWRVETYMPWARYHPVIQKLEEKIPVGHVGCGAARGIAVIQPSGRVVPCVCFDVPASAMGNVRDQDLRAILQESPVRAMMKRPQDYGICDGCIHLSTCGGGCRATAFALSGDLAGADETCPLRRVAPRQ